MRRGLKTQSLYMPSSEAKNNLLNSKQRTFKANEGLLMEPINLHPRSIDIKQLTLGGGIPRSSTVRPLFAAPSFSKLLVAEPLPGKSTCRSRCHPSGYGRNVVPFNWICILFECTSITTPWWRENSLPPCLSSCHEEDLSREQGSWRHQAPVCFGVGVVSMFNQWEAVCVHVCRASSRALPGERTSISTKSCFQGTRSWDGAMERHNPTDTIQGAETGMGKWKPPKKTAQQPLKWDSGRTG